MARVWDENWFGSTKTLDVHIRWLRQKLGDAPDAPALPAHRPRRRLPLHRAGGVRVTLRARLLLALAYVLLLAIVALEVPLALSLRDRVDAEVRSQARAQADVVAATVAGHLATPRRSTTPSARRRDGPRPRRDRRPRRRVLADTAGTDRLGTDYGNRPEIARRCGGARSRTAATATRSTRKSSPPRSPSSRRGRASASVRVTQSVDAVSRATAARRSAWPRSACSCSRSASPRAS